MENIVKSMQLTFIGFAGEDLQSCELERVKIDDIENEPELSLPWLPGLDWMMTSATLDNVIYYGWSFLGNVYIVISLALLHQIKSLYF